MNAWRAVAVYIGDCDISDFGRDEARALLSRMLAEGRSVATCKTRMALLHQMVDYAAEELGIGVKTAPWRLRYPPEQKPRQVFTRQQLGKIIRLVAAEAAQGKYSNLPVLIAASTGMRIGEVCGLRWGDIDLRSGWITVQRTATPTYDPTGRCERINIGPPKSASGYRRVSISKQLRQALRHYGGKARKPETYVVGMGTEPVRTRIVSRQYHRFLSLNRLPQLKFHALRHTFATIMVEGVKDVKAISEMLGHSTVSTTLNLYVHPPDEVKRTAIDRTMGRLCHCRHRIQGPNGAND
jgi:integrase